MSEHTSQRQASAQLPIIPGLPSCTIQIATNGIWHVAAQLGTGEQEAPVSALPLDVLCQRAQHALGLAGIGSRIEDTYTAIGVYAASLPSPSGQFLLILDGRVLLWSIAHASSEAIQALIDAAIEHMCAAPTPSSTSSRECQKRSTSQEGSGGTKCP
jgi:hypothetical protein